jgi:hypothetical protein
MPKLDVRFVPCPFVCTRCRSVEEREHTVRDRLARLFYLAPLDVAHVARLATSVFPHRSATRRSLPVLRGHRLDCLAVEIVPHRAPGSTGH